MDILKVYLLKINVLVILLSVLCIYMSYRFFTGKEKIKGNRKTAKLISLIAGVFFLAGGIFLPLDITLDNINFVQKEIIATVVSKNSYFLSRVIVENVILDDQNEYHIYFNNPSIESGKKYRIIYVPRSKIILNAEEVN